MCIQRASKGDVDGDDDDASLIFHSSVLFVVFVVSRL